MKYLRYRLKWLLSKYILFRTPVHLDLELNTNCNQKCIDCWHFDGIDFEDMPIQIVKDALRGAREKGFMSVKFNLRGEPLLYINLNYAVKYAHIYGFTDIMINTNGVLLTQKKLIELSALGLTTCVISVDSFDKKTYCKIHNCKHSDYSALLVNLDDAIELVKNKLIKTRIKLNFHINQYNKDEDFSIYYNHVFKYLKPVFRYTEKRKGKDISIDRDRKRKKKCTHARRRLTVMANGDTYPCCLCYDKPQDLLLNYRGVDPLVMRKLFIKKYEKGIMPETCKTCASGDLWK